MIESTTSIAGSGHPLAFRTAPARGASPLAGAGPGRGALRVEARAIGGHQKEALVEGADGARWRLTSDEGPALGGTDLAPFPLGFFSAGLMADVLGRIVALAPAHDVPVTAASLATEHYYAFSGSFFAGTGRGSAEAPRLDLALSSGAPATALKQLVRAALDASPAIAALRTPLANTFALYVNGRRHPVEGVHASTTADVIDPFKAHASAPAPTAGAADLPDLIAKVHGAPPKSASLPGQSDRIEIVIGGAGHATLADSGVHAESWIVRPGGSRFALKADEAGTGARAPAGLALYVGGIAFCYLTQLLRYIEYRKHKVRAVRIVQVNPFTAGTRAAAGPVDTHLFVNADEPDDVMQKLLLYAANTCYLHAALGRSLEPRVSLAINGAPALPLE
ncbi:MAG: hypothetical protein JNM79_16705 [Burkholderiales bacterium]|nr:hypothetical protein [Burkholderiales bacterium]